MPPVQSVKAVTLVLLLLLWDNLLLRLVSFIHFNG
jgi:hypothetical protein